MMSTSIALVGLACVYPDARSPAELWENVLAGRRAFRRMPPERLRLEDYWSADRDAADRTYAVEAAVIEGYEFDRVAIPRGRPELPVGRPGALAGPRRGRAGPGRCRIRRRGGPPPRDDRRLPGQHADRRVLARERAAAALALCPADDRRGPPRRGLVDRSASRGVPGPARRRVQVAVPAGRRGDARRQPVEHDRRADLQPLRPEGGRLHRRRGLRLVAAGGRPRLLVAGGRRPRRGAGRRRRSEPRPVRAGRLRQGRRPGRGRDAGLRPRGRPASGRARAAASSC